MGHVDSRHKATTTQRKKLVVAEVRQQEEAARCTKAVSQPIQGQWTRWKNVEHHQLTWRDLWEIDGSPLSFIIRATYNVLPKPKNLSQCVREDPLCALCQTTATLSHILTSCKTSLSQGRYTRTRNRVLQQLTITLEGRRTTNNVLPPPMPRQSNITPFIRAGQLSGKPTARVEAALLDTAQEWRMQANLDQKLIFPPVIITTNLRPDLILRSTLQKYIMHIVALSTMGHRGRTTWMEYPGAPCRSCE